MGNPAIFPLIYSCDSRDVVIVHINPIERHRTWRCSRRGCGSLAVPSRMHRDEDKTTWSSNMCAQGTPDEFWRNAYHRNVLLIPQGLQQQG